MRLQWCGSQCKPDHLWGVYLGESPYQQLIARRKADTQIKLKALPQHFAATVTVISTIGKAMFTKRESSHIWSVLPWPWLPNCNFEWCGNVNGEGYQESTCVKFLQENFYKRCYKYM
jgi:hypothetical protein